MFPVPVEVLELGVQAANRKTPTIVIGKNLSALFKRLLLGIEFLTYFPRVSKSTQEMKRRMACVEWAIMPNII